MAAIILARFECDKPKYKIRVHLLVVAFLTKQFVVWVGGESDVLVGEVLLADGALEAGGVKGHTHRPDHLAPDLFFANVTP